VSAAIPRLSVCVPTRNGAPWIGETLRALLALEFPSFEVVVGDDASTDGTPDLADAFDDPRVRVHRFRDWVGLGANWNRTLQLARGEYVALVCQDDLVSPQWASRLIDLLDTHGDADLAFCRRSFRFEDAAAREALTGFFSDRYPQMLRRFYERIGAVIPPDLMVEESLKHLFEINLIGEPSFAILRRNARAVQQGFNPSLQQMIDWEFFTRFFDRPVLHCPETLGVFRLHAGGTTRTNSLRRHYEEYAFLLGVVAERFHRYWTDEQRAALEARRSEIRSLASPATASAPAPARHPQPWWSAVAHGGAGLGSRARAVLTRQSVPDISARPLIIAGMHRSGTSLAAALLESAGLSIGERLMKGNWSNPRGHFEDMDFVDFQRDVLIELGLSKHGWVSSDLPRLPGDVVARARALVESKRGRGGGWGWKDPRTVLFLPLWSSLLPDARFALVYRAPWEVIDSLFRRGDAVFADDPELAIAMWLQYNRRILDISLSAPDHCVLANVSTIAADSAAWVDAVAGCLGVSLHGPQQSIYEAKLLHSDQAEERVHVLLRLFPEVMELFATLERRAFRPAGMKALKPRVHGWTAEEEKRQAMRYWQASCAVSAERDHMRNELDRVNAALESARRAISDAAEAASETTSRLTSPPGQSVKWSV
jgi:glycosyltransferase involved in cell wall biosynthesis